MWRGWGDGGGGDGNGGGGWMVQSAPMGSSLNATRQFRAGAHNMHKGKKKGLLLKKQRILMYISFSVLFSVSINIS